MDVAFFLFHKIYIHFLGRLFLGNREYSAATAQRLYPGQVAFPFRCRWVMCGSTLTISHPAIILQNFLLGYPRLISRGLPVQKVAIFFMERRNDLHKPEQVIFFLGQKKRILFFWDKTNTSVSYGEIKLSRSIRRTIKKIAVFH